MANEQSDHLTTEARKLLDEPNEVRIRHIRGGTWVAYPRAKRVIARLEELLAYPRVTRMPNMLLVAPSFNGKTSILEHFTGLHPPDLDPLGESSVCPVIMVEAPSTPDASALWSRILDALMAPYKPTASKDQKYAQVKLLIRSLGVRMLIVDEIHHLISGGKIRQQEFRNALKSLGNETKIVIVAAGIEDAYNAFASDPQMSSRFTPEQLPLWKADLDFGGLLSTMERRTPLRKPSNLKDPVKMQEIHIRSEGTLGDACDLFKELAVDAVKTGAEEITLEQIKRLPWVPPSKRKHHRQH